MEQMAKDAEAHAEADKQKRAKIEVRNEADAAVHNTKKNLDEHKANLPQEVQDDVQTKIVELEQLLSDDEADAEAVRKAVDELQQSAMKMGEAIYKNSSVRALLLPRAQHMPVSAATVREQALRLSEPNGHHRALRTRPQSKTRSSKTKTKTRRRSRRQIEMRSEDGDAARGGYALWPPRCAAQTQPTVTQETSVSVCGRRGTEAPAGC